MTPVTQPDRVTVRPSQREAEPLPWMPGMVVQSTTMQLLAAPAVGRACR